MTTAAKDSATTAAPPTVYHIDLGLYSSVEVSGTIDAALDELLTRYGFSFPMSNLVMSDPYASLMERVTHGIHLGTAMVDGARCHHLAFRSPGLDWQIWIEDSIWHHPRKYVLVFTDLPGTPQFRARMSEWDYICRSKSIKRYVCCEGEAETRKGALLEEATSQSSPVH